MVGSIQYAEETDPDYRHAGIDLFLTTDVHGQGVGTDAIRTVARYLIDVLGHHRLTIDPVGGQRAGDPRLFEGGIPTRSASCASTSAARTARSTTACFMDLLADELR